MEQLNNQPQSQQFVCSGDCKKCKSIQWGFCASVHAYSNMKVLDKVMETLGKMQEEISAMQGAVKEMSDKIEAIQNSEASVFDPSAGYAQQGDGAGTIEPRDSLIK